MCFATSRPANHVICSFIDPSGYESGPIRSCLFIDYIINLNIEIEMYDYIQYIFESGNCLTHYVCYQPFVSLTIMFKMHTKIKKMKKKTCRGRPMQITDGPHH